MLVNLFANALDAMLDCPVRRLTITVRADQSDDAFAEIIVSDTGPGIPETVRARLFEPFFTTKPPGAGLGLGLAISAGIVREFGGTLKVEDCAENEGASFSLRLRRASTEVQQGDPHSDAAGNIDHAHKIDAARTVTPTPPRIEASPMPPTEET